MVNGLIEWDGLSVRRDRTSSQTSGTVRTALSLSFSLSLSLCCSPSLCFSGQTHFTSLSLYPSCHPLKVTSAEWCFSNVKQSQYGECLLKGDFKMPEYTSAAFQKASPIREKNKCQLPKKRFMELDDKLNMFILWAGHSSTGIRQDSWTEWKTESGGRLGRQRWEWLESDSDGTWIRIVVAV